MATKLEEGGGKVLVAGPLKKELYVFAASLINEGSLTVQYVQNHGQTVFSVDRMII